MKISLITVCYNAEETLQETIDSVKNQTYDHIEYIVIDGKSNDETLNIIKKNSSFINNWISEKDHGIYDAMNKGIQMSTGEIVAFLNGDDMYAYPDAVAEMVQLLKNENVDSCYADLVYVDNEKPEKVIRTWKSGTFNEDLFLKGWMPPHPTFFVRKAVYDRYGAFKLNLGTAADYEIMLRFLHKHKIKVAYLPKSIVKMRAGGVSNASFLNRLKANHNDRKAWKVNGLKTRFYTLLLKPLRKIGQFFRINVNSS